MISTIRSQVLNNKARLAGLSTDLKPTVYPERPDVEIPNGSEFLEMDTNTTFYYDSISKQWLNGASPVTTFRTTGATATLDPIQYDDSVITLEKGYTLTDWLDYWTPIMFSYTGVYGSYSIRKKKYPELGALMASSGVPLEVDHVIKMKFFDDYYTGVDVEVSVLFNKDIRVNGMYFPETKLWTEFVRIHGVNFPITENQTHVTDVIINRNVVFGDIMYANMKLVVNVPTPNKWIEIGTINNALFETDTIIDTTFSILSKKTTVMMEASTGKVYVQSDSAGTALTIYIQAMVPVMYLPLA